MGDFLYIKKKKNKRRNPETEVFRVGIAPYMWGKPQFRSAQKWVFYIGVSIYGERKSFVFNELRMKWYRNICEKPAKTPRILCEFFMLFFEGSRNAERQWNQRLAEFFTLNSWNLLKSAICSKRPEFKAKISILSREVLYIGSKTKRETSLLRVKSYIKAGNSEISGLIREIR